MAALCSVTWAWFSEDVTSSYNNIQSANCYVSVSVANENLSRAEDGKYTFTFYKDTAYKMKLTATGTAETAYCILNINGNEYCTDQIQIPGEMEFTLQFSEETTVEILPCWGTSSKATRDFANGLFYLNCNEVDPATIVVPPPQTEPADTAETTPETEPQNTTEYSSEITE